LGPNRSYGKDKTLAARVRSMGEYPVKVARRRRAGVRKTGNRGSACYPDDRMPLVPIVCVIAAFLTAGAALAQSEEGDSSASAATESGAPAFAQSTADESWKQDVLVALIGAGARARRIHLEVGAGTDTKRGRPWRSAA